MLFNKKNTVDKPSLTNEPEEAGWIDYEEPEIEGQLAIDVYHDARRIIIKSTIAGVKPEDLKISLHNDLLTIKGVRSTGQNIQEENYLYRECYWGSFSRSIILPVEVDSKRVEAELENGVLTITLYKNTPSPIDVKVKD
jgi:HSP20 family protein